MLSNTDLGLSPLSDAAILDNIPDIPEEKFFLRREYGLIDYINEQTDKYVAEARAKTARKRVAAGSVTALGHGQGVNVESEDEDEGEGESLGSQDDCSTNEEEDDTENEGEGVDLGSHEECSTNEEVNNIGDDTSDWITVTDADGHDLTTLADAPENSVRGDHNIDGTERDDGDEDEGESLGSQDEWSTDGEEESEDGEGSGWSTVVDAHEYDSASKFNTPGDSLHDINDVEADEHKGGGTPRLQLELAPSNDVSIDQPVVGNLKVNKLFADVTAMLRKPQDEVTRMRERVTGE